MGPSHIPDIGARHLSAVLAVAEYRSFIAAAAALHTSQPALTRSIKRVEDILGVQLFVRTTRTVSITEAGREFVAVAQRIANDLRITVESMREVAEQKRGQVIVSSIVSIANGMLPGAVARYRQNRPGIEVQVRVGIHGDVNEDIKSGVADFGINYLKDVPEAFVTEHFGRGYFDVIASRNHPIATTGRKRIRFDELGGVPLVSLPSDSQTRRMLDTTAVARGIRLHHAVVVSQIPTLLSFVRAGVGVGLVPSVSVTGSLGEDLVRLTVHEPKISLDIGIVRLKDRSLPPAAEGLLSEITSSWPAN